MNNNCNNRENMRVFIINILASISFVFLFLPVSMPHLGFIKIISDIVKQYWIGSIAFVLFLLMSFCPKLKELWYRYKNTCRLGRLTWLDNISVFISLSFILINVQYIFKVPLVLDIFVIPSIVFLLFRLWIVFLEPYIGRRFFRIYVKFRSSFSKYFRQHREKENASSDVTNSYYLLSDAPIESAEQDLLGRKKFIDDLYKEITAYSKHFSDSFVFGLYASWGEGKSSVLNLLKNKIKRNKQFIIVDFNPWYFKDEEAILTAFYEQLEQAISKEFFLPNIKRLFKKYKGLISTGLSKVGISSDFSFIDEALKDVKDRIEKYIEQIDRKIIIFIDDIDRLTKREILLIFKLVRHNSGFKNTIFVLSFDLKIVNESLENIPIQSEFLDKIVQQLIPLPKIEQIILKKYLYSNIEQILKKLEILDKDKKEFMDKFFNVYDRRIKNLFKTLRDVKRFLNSVRSTLLAIYMEVNLFDLFILEIIKMFYHDVFNDIWGNRWSYIPLECSEDKRDIVEAIKKRHYKKEQTDIEYINQICQRYGNSKGEILKELLKEIFCEVESIFNNEACSKKCGDCKKQKYITCPDYFDKYFLLQVPSHEISYRDMEDILSNLNLLKEQDAELYIKTEILGRIKKEKKLESFLSKIKEEHFLYKIKQDAIIGVIRGLYKEISFDLDSDYEGIRRLLLILIDERISREKIQNIVEEIIEKAPDIYFVCDIAEYCYRYEQAYNNIYNSVQKEKLQKKVAERLSQYFIKAQNNIFDYSERQIYDILLIWEDCSNDKDVVKNYIFSLIENNAKNFAKFLLSKGVEKGFNTANLNNLKKIYDVNELKKFAEKFKDDNSLLDKEREAIEEFLSFLG